MDVPLVEADLFFIAAQADVRSRREIVKRANVHLKALLWFGPKGAPWIAIFPAVTTYDGTASMGNHVVVFSVIRPLPGLSIELRPRNCTGFRCACSGACSICRACGGKPVDMSSS
jgi:hypothetical protein